MSSRPRHQAVSEPPQTPEPRPGRSGSEPAALDLMATGITMALLVGGGLGLGWLVDDWLGSSPVATLVGLALGVAMAGLALWERARQYL